MEKANEVAVVSLKLTVLEISSSLDYIVLLLEYISLSRNLLWSVRRLWAIKRSVGVSNQRFILMYFAWHAASSDTSTPTDCDKRGYRIFQSSYCGLYIFLGDGVVAADKKYSSHALTKRAHEDDRVAQSELRVLSRWKYWPRQAMQELPDKLLIRETSAARSPCEDDSSHALTKQAYEDDRVAQSELRVLSHWKYRPRQAMQELPDKLLICETSAARSPCEDGQPV
ncbi:hypothetical protein JRO89_XS08G0035000 [Xanthoceras sorbifolium]|uniref:Uncharacterized protein n=1 Tax=Xanthoceras sorbifolium TaxID=99658 RepID=A0ABQ8HNP5_9ROSI|nr:hypothetical protein JRO89_XS08G0035000 [Xanthoceras sorbifolium]